MTRANSFNSRALFYTPAHWLGSNTPGVAAYHWPGYRSVAIDARPVLTPKIRPSYGSGLRGPDIIFNLSTTNLYFIVAKIALIITSYFYLSYSFFMIIFLSFNLKYIFPIDFYRIAK